MKFNFSKTVILSVMIIAMTFSMFVSVARPEKVQAAGVLESIFQVIADPSTHLGNWVQNTFWSLAFNAPLKLACGGEKDMDAIFIEGVPCTTPEEANSFLASYDGTGPVLMKGGLASLTSNIAGTVVSDPQVPTNFALYLNDVKSDTIFGKNAYAATGLSEPTPFLEQATLSTWKITRNIALSLLGVFLAIAALGVLFRQKLSPQAVVTIYSVLPSVPIAILVIVLSYPLVAIAMNLNGPLNSLFYKLGMDIFQEMASTVSFNLGSTVTMIAIFALLFSNPVTAVAGTILSIPIIIIAISLIALVVVGLIKLIYEYAKWYATFVVLVIAFPLAGAVSVLPGKQGLVMVFLKKLLVNMLVFPVSIFLVFIGLGFMVSSIETTGFGGWSGYVLPYGILVTMVKFFIGFGFIWNAFKIRGVLENALGASGSVMSIIQAGGQPEKPRR